jgi:hypothetical protein
MKWYIFRQSLRLHETFLCSTISLFFLLDGDSLTDILAKLCLKNLMKIMLSIRLTGERLLKWWSR